MKHWIYRLVKWPFLSIYAEYSEDEMPSRVFMDKESRIHNLVQCILRVLWMNKVTFLGGEKQSNANENLPLLSVEVTAFEMTFMSYGDIYVGF